MIHINTETQDLCQPHWVTQTRNVSLLFFSPYLSGMSYSHPQVRGSFSCHGDHMIASMMRRLVGDDFSLFHVMAYTTPVPLFWGPRPAAIVRPKVYFSLCYCVYSLINTGESLDGARIIPLRGSFIEFRFSSVVIQHVLIPSHHIAY